MLKSFGFLLSTSDFRTEADPLICSVLRVRNFEIRVWFSLEWDNKYSILFDEISIFFFLVLESRRKNGMNRPWLLIEILQVTIVSKNVVAYFELRLNWGSEEKRGDGVTQVHLNVYDITHVNNYLCWSGIIQFWNIQYVYSISLHNSSLLYNFVIWWKPFLWVCISWTIFIYLEF